MIGTVRFLYYRLPCPDDEDPTPSSGDFMQVARTGTTYRILQALDPRDVEEPWRANDAEDPLDGVVMLVRHVRLKVERIEPDERPEDAMTWSIVWDSRRRQPSA